MTYQYYILNISCQAMVQVAVEISSTSIKWLGLNCNLEEVFYEWSQGT